MTIQFNDVLAFWSDRMSVDGQHSSQNDVSAEMRDKFGELLEQARAGDLSSWLCGHDSCLALVLLLDQFPRLMFPKTAQSFASDAAGLAIAKRAIVMGHDLKVSEEMRQFFYRPLMHSESLMDQERCVRLMSLRLPCCTPAQLSHARAHRDIIRQFGRFPCRNGHLGRANTPAEERYLAKGGYSSVVSALAA